MLNQQVQLITRIYSITPFHPLFCEAGLAPTSTLLDYHQRLYTYKLFRLSDQYTTIEILPASFRVRESSFQTEILPRDILT